MSKGLRDETTGRLIPTYLNVDPEGIEEILGYIQWQARDLHQPVRYHLARLASLPAEERQALLYRLFDNLNGVWHTLWESGGRLGNEQRQCEDGGITDSEQEAILPTGEDEVTRWRVFTVPQVLDWGRAFAAAAAELLGWMEQAVATAGPEAAAQVATELQYAQKGLDRAVEGLRAAKAPVWAALEAAGQLEEFEVEGGLFGREIHFRVRPWDRPAGAEEKNDE